MPESILTTKLQPSPLREPAVHRPRLTAKLARAAAHRLTVIAAPAGFGKSTLLGAWLATEAARAGWLALDPHDDAAPRFLRYLVAALQQIDSTIGSQALALLDSGHIPATETVLATLINDLAATARPAFLVLDDYHVIESPAIHAALDFLLAHAPPQLHLVIAGRATPPLALARLRSQAQLLEIHAADLRFTATEIDEFLGAVMHLDLPPADRIALEMRTEGWVAGLQLAALSLQGEDDKHAFIAAFRGADRHIADYLFEEVLRHLSPARQRFLLCTSVADQLCAGLCDAINGGSDGQATLENLDRANLFVVPLDHDRRWYR
ncbi:MAG: helix-turn-helix transcriptional regulator, partial [Caldilineaceae bacterium]|nr:helix-turn-helix transcriptional regulator [Caldilineaceae bacterium]